MLQTVGVKEMSKADIVFKKLARRKCKKVKYIKTKMRDDFRIKK